MPDWRRIRSRDHQMQQIKDINGKTEIPNKICRSASTIVYQGSLLHFTMVIQDVTVQGS